MPRKKKIEELIEDGVIEGEEITDKWHFGKIFIGLLIALFLGYFSYIIVADISQKIHQKATQILQYTTQTAKQPIPNEVRLPTSSDLSAILNDLKINLTQITTNNFSSSHSALMSVINELQQVKSGKKNINQVICDLTCK